MFPFALPDIISVDPEEVVPFDDSRSQRIYVSSLSVKPIAFKIKINGPLEYFSVKPHAGIIDPRLVQEIGIAYRPFKSDRGLQKYALQIHVIEIPDHFAELSLQELWSSTPAHKIGIYKLKLVFPELAEQFRYTKIPRYVPQRNLLSYVGLQRISKIQRYVNTVNQDFKACTHADVGNQIEDKAASGGASNEEVWGNEESQSNVDQGWEVAQDGGNGNESNPDQGWGDGNDDGEARSSLDVADQGWDQDYPGSLENGGKEADQQGIDEQNQWLTSECNEEINKDFGYSPSNLNGEEAENFLGPSSAIRKQDKSHSVRESLVRWEDLFSACLFCIAVFIVGLIFGRAGF